MQSEEQLLETLKNWNFLKGYIKRLESKLEEKDYKITTSYSDTKSFSSGLSVSKVETYCFSRYEDINELKSVKRKMDLCIEAYHTANLTKEERLTIYYTCAGKSLLELAKSLGMAQARIYRIRKKAVKKMYFKIQNGVKNR